MVVGISASSPSMAPPARLRTALTSSARKTPTSTPTSIRRTPPRRHASTSVLFALSALSNSRETQHFNKLSHLPRIEHSPPLKLIKSSEVDPFPLPAPPPRAAVPVPSAAPRSRASAAGVWDTRALSVGRAVLADQSRKLHAAQRALTRSQSRASRQSRLAERERAEWRAERHKYRAEMRTAGTLLLLAIGTTTALATWRFWPERKAVDSGEMGRRIAEKAQGSLGASGLGSASEGYAAAPAIGPMVEAAAAPAVEPALATAPVVAEVAAPKRSWWEGLFWKQP